MRSSLRAEVFRSTIFGMSLATLLAAVLLVSTSCGSAPVSNAPVSSPPSIPVQQAVTITSIDPNPISASNLPQLITINGSNFVPNSNVSYSAQGQSPAIQPLNSQSSEQITLFAVFPISGQTGSLQVSTPTSTSNSVNLSVVQSNTTQNITDYPFPNAPFCNISPCPPNTIDPWDFYFRECTSYVAWRMNRDTGRRMQPWDQSDPGTFWNNMSAGHWGNAGNWDANAKILGYVVDYVPAVGAIAQWNFADKPSNHVAYVEKVNSDGSVDVSDYNWGLPPLDHLPQYHTGFAPRYIHINDHSASAFNISVNSNNETFTQGQSASFLVNVQSMNGNSGQISFHALNLPPGYASTTGWSSDTANLSSNGAISSTLFIGTTSLTQTGSFTVTLRVTSGNVSSDYSVTIQILPVQSSQAFGTQVDTTSNVISLGQSASFTVTVQSIGGFSSPVDLFAINLPPGYDPATYWSQPTLTPLPNGVVNSTLYIYTNSGTSTGVFPITLRTASTGFVTRDIPVNLTINSSGATDFGISVNTTSQTIAQGQSATFVVTVQSTGGFSSPVDLFAINLPPGYDPATYWSQPIVTPFPNGSATSTLTVVTTSGTSKGTFTIILRAASTGFVTKEVNVTLIIQ